MAVFYRFDGSQFVQDSEYDPLRAQWVSASEYVRLLRELSDAHDQIKSLEVRVFLDNK